LNSSLLGYLNGIAKNAAAANDQSTMGIMDKMYQDAAYIGSAYDTAASYTTHYYIGASGTAGTTTFGDPGNQTSYPLGSIAPSYDTMFAYGQPVNIKLSGG